MNHAPATASNPRRRDHSRIVVWHQHFGDRLPPAGTPVLVALANGLVLAGETDQWGNWWTPDGWPFGSPVTAWARYPQHPADPLP